MMSKPPPARPDSQPGSRSKSEDLVRDVMRRLPHQAFVASVARSVASDASARALLEPPTQEGLLLTMLSALELTGSERVLEIGSTSAYATVLLSQLAREVVSLDGDPDSARARVLLLAALGCHNVRVFAGQGPTGWPDAAPYQAIIVVGGASRLPQRLLDQLDTEGRLVIPLGDATGQLIQLVRKRVDGVVCEALGPSHLAMLPWPNRRPSFFPWSGTKPAPS